MSQFIPRAEGPSIKGGRTLIGGVALVAAGLGIFYMNLQRREANKEIKDKDAPGAIPTWKYRLNQASHVDGPQTDSASLRASRVESRSTTLNGINYDNDGKHSVISRDKAEEGTAPQNRVSQPTPQRDGGDGMAYTKAPDYKDSYNKSAKKAKTEKEEEVENASIL
ncbi:hypothetical protein JAAARDRAFT_206524 [Jaapia argillacea MUCL 33604]|uniref:Uncharacterized protein n=1 Tax=Jaapia argillacea MUCL 33604 TaxID=933084 RepID=A0A067PV02_9AGAM|nr:hypothetical protein JAAARDRAFT_206524 [Jaapia argillacea MUCL 33604]